jgi:hypothetical protein
MAKPWKSSGVALAVVLCAMHAIFIWILASNNSPDHRDLFIGSIVSQTGASPTSIAAGQFLENSGGAEIECVRTR